MKNASPDDQKPPEMSPEGANLRAGIGCLIASIAIGVLLFAFGLGAYSEYQNIKKGKENTEPPAIYSAPES